MSRIISTFRPAALLSGIALATAAAAFQAQPTTPEAKAQGGLGDLQQTVQQLQDRPPEGQTTPPPAAPPSSNLLITPSRQPASRPAPATAAAAPALAAAQTAAINRAATRGRQLIALTRAGMLATQDMLSQIANPEAAGIDGWIVEPQGETLQVIFFDDRSDGPVTVFRANVVGQRVASRDNFPNTFKPPLSRAQARLARALMAVRALNHTACSPAGFNYLVVPPQGEEGMIDVYEVTINSQRGRLQVGGHFRTSVRPNGEVAQTHAFASACAEAELVAVPAGETPPAAVIPAGADPLPTELHVLLSQMSNRALTFTAGAPPREWLVAGSRIAEMRDGTPAFVPSPN